MPLPKVVSAGSITGHLQGSGSYLAPFYNKWVFWVQTYITVTEMCTPDNVTAVT